MTFIIVVVVGDPISMTITAFLRAARVDGTSNTVALMRENVHKGCAINDRVYCITNANFEGMCVVRCNPTIGLQDWRRTSECVARLRRPQYVGVPEAKPADGDGAAGVVNSNLLAVHENVEGVTA